MQMNIHGSNSYLGNSLRLYSFDCSPILNVTEIIHFYDLSIVMNISRYLSIMMSWST